MAEQSRLKWWKCLRWRYGLKMAKQAEQEKMMVENMEKMAKQASSLKSASRPNVDW